MAWLVVKSKNDKQLILTDEYVTYGNLTIVEKFSNRFKDDKVLFTDNTQMCVIDGVILNKTELLEESNLTTLKDWIIQRKDRNNKNVICSDLRGPFTGCYYSIESAESARLYAFGNQTGDAAVFYYNDNGYFIVSSDFNMVFDVCKENGLKLTFNEIAANHMMSLGFLVEGNTFAKEIRRVKPGEMVMVNGQNVSEEIYHRFSNTDIQNVTLEEAVELIDKGFRKAIKRCFDKDLEYGYEHHLADMSGGLDSRMTTCVAKEMGYKNITNICYAKAKSDEADCAMAAAIAFDNEFIFGPLDDLKFFFDVDEIVKKNYGLAIYNGITGGNRFLSSLNFDKYGLEHTGQLGDVTIGSFCKSAKYKDIKDICHSDIIEPKLYEADLYDNSEIYAMYYRGFQGALTSHFIRRNYTEAVSPFIDLEFMQLCFSLPLEYRCGHVLYWKWIHEKYPIAAKIPSTRKPPQNVEFSWRDIARKLVGKNQRLILRLLSAMGLARIIYESDSMNPFDHWYHTNSSLRDFMRTYFEEHINLIDEFPETKQLLRELYEGERVTDKSLAITVLGVYSVYFNK